MRVAVGALTPAVCGQLADAEGAVGRVEQRPQEVELGDAQAVVVAQAHAGAVPRAGEVVHGLAEGLGGVLGGGGRQGGGHLLRILTIVRLT